MNQLGGLFQSVVAAASSAADNLQYANAIVDAAFWDFKPEYPGPNTSMAVIIPTVNEGDVTDIQNGSLNITDTDHNTFSVPFNKHYSTSFVIKTWDRARTPVDLERKYIKPRFEALLRSVNKTLALLLNTTNFGTSATPVAGYSLLTGATSGYFLRSDLKPAWVNLANNGCPIEDSQNLFLITSPNAYGGMVTDLTNSYQYVTGQQSASDAQQHAKLQMQLGAQVRYDQHYGQLGVTNGFTSGKEPAALMHRYAIAAVATPPPPTDEAKGVVQEQIIWLKNVLPVQIQTQFDLKQQGTVVNIHCYWGCTPARADFCSLIQSA